MVISKEEFFKRTKRIVLDDGFIAWTCGTVKCFECPYSFTNSNGEFGTCRGKHTEEDYQELKMIEKVKGNLQQW